MHNVSFDYFSEITAMCSALVSATGEIDRLLGDFNKKELGESVIKVKKLSELAHIKKRAANAQLYSDFMPPLERGDIMIIADSLSLAVDGVLLALHEMQVWGISNSTGEAIEFSDLAHRSAQKIEGLSRSLARFRRDRALPAKVGDIAELLREREALYVDALSALVGRTSNAAELLARSRIYAALDEMCGRCERAADSFGTAILKNI